MLSSQGKHSSLALLCTGEVRRWEGVCMQPTLPGNTHLASPAPLKCLKTYEKSLGLLLPYCVALVTGQ